MKKVFALIGLLALTVGALAGCRGSVDVDPHGSSGVSVAR